MPEIKVGQIYKSKYNSNIKVAITQETLAGFNIIYTDGSVQKAVNAYEFDDIWVFENEYPTWQEAVNSKEFNQKKGEENESR